MPLGLSQNEANQKLKIYGLNEITEEIKITPFRILLRQLKGNFVVFLLLVAAIVSFLVGKTFTGYTVSAVISVVVIIGFLQEYKAEQAVAELKKMIMPVTIALRDGRKKEVLSKELVLDDVIILGNGEKIPADCELIEQYDLRVNESSLTGESKEVVKQSPIKNVDLNDDNKIFMGTYIVNGRCVAKVLHTGMNTRFGKIAHLISTAEKELPLQKKVNNIAKYMIIMAITVSIATGILMVMRAPVISRGVLAEILVLSVAIAVSAFPEGFPVVLVTTLAIGAKRMSKHNAIVNRLSIIETLGEVTTICSDKTGTITRGEMTVKFLYTGTSLYEVEGSGYLAHGNILKNNQPVSVNDYSDLAMLIEAGLLCNNAEIQRTGIDNEYKAIGSPTESALLILGAKTGTFLESFEYNRISEKPFNSDRKMMSVLVSKKNENKIFVKGAPEVLIQKCNKLVKDGWEIDFDENTKEYFLKMQEEMASNAYRTLALAHKNFDDASDDYDEDNLVFLGIAALEDPPREEVTKSIKIAQNAGIKVIMITGDNKNTAISIANQIGIKGSVMDGQKIDELSDDELRIALRNVSIFSRVRPEHKIRIVKALKDLDEVVAMTGDGVNDAPALKEAHIGIAMGKNGTDVSRSVSDLILKDDNFATIVSAISEGRTIFNNLRKFITYQLSCNTAELIILFIGTLLSPIFGWYIPILASIQILFMNLVTDNLPALTLGLNPPSADIMEEMPRKNSMILNKSLIKLLITSAVIMSASTLVIYFISYNVLNYDANLSRSTALVTLILIEITAAFSFRSFRKNILNRSPFVNRHLVTASAISICATLLILYTPLNYIFESYPIGLVSWLIAITASLAVAVIYDLLKFINNKSLKYTADTR